MDKKEVYRVKKGKANSKNFDMPFDFGLVFEENGVYSIEFYSIESLLYSHENVDELFDEYFTVSCLTKDDHLLNISHLRVKFATFTNSEIHMICYGSITHTANELEILSKISDDKSTHKEIIHYLEL